MVGEAWWLCVPTCVRVRAAAGWSAVIAVPSAECPARCKQQLMSVFIARCIEVHGEL